MKETILFVDDDINLLRGLERMLRPMRSNWEMTFVSSPNDAINLMTQRCFDVVVTDMRMPEMDGTVLLEEVKKVCPRSVRIILSGQAEVGAIVESVSTVHQYLSKPCDPEVLKSAITRASKLRRLMGNVELESFVSKLHVIPSQADVYDAVLAELVSMEPKLDRIAELMARDIGMSLKVLQLTNSAFFGEKREVLSARQAVQILGVAILRELFSNGRVFSKCNDGEVGLLDLKKLHDRGASVGGLAYKIASLEGLKGYSAESFFSSGLVSRVGCIVLGMYKPRGYDRIIRFAEECQASVDEEIKLLGTSHSEIGSYLLGLWGLPDSLVEATSHHHDCNCVEQPKLTVLSALQIAEHLASSVDYPPLDGFVLGICKEKYGSLLH